MKYILVGGHAVRLNGFLRSTEDIDILLPSSIENGKRVIRALNFLSSSAELQPEWFECSAEEPENIRVADDLLQDHRPRQGCDRSECAVAHPESAQVGLTAGVPTAAEVFKAVMPAPKMQMFSKVAKVA